MTMRKVAILVLLGAAGCSGEAEQKPADTAIRLQPGQWEVTTEVGDVAVATKGAPTVKAAAGPTTTLSCITPEQVERPDAALFAGDGGDCSYQNFYMARGRLNAGLSCRQSGDAGSFYSMLSGNYTATTFEAKIDTSSSVAGAGNMRMSVTMKGRRIGDCPPAAPAAKTS
jgi:hypothetical protein